MKSFVGLGHECNNSGPGGRGAITAESEIMTGKTQVGRDKARSS